MDYHLPVMLNECIEGLNIRPDGTYVDATFGGGGHSRAIMSHLGDEGRLIAFDQDADALTNALDDPRFTLLNENFRHVKSFLRLHGVRKVDGILADLGVSSHQFDVAERGFSTRYEGALDLRMDQRQELTARDIVNSADEQELERILRLYGELPNARQTARAIVAARATKAIETTFDLREAVRRLAGESKGRLAGENKGRPAGENKGRLAKENKYLAMLFQALRIEVNGELDALQALLRQSLDLLNPGGRLVVMSYHSLEDRLVKNFFKTGNFEGVLEKDFYGNPLVPLRMVTRKAVTASEEELQRNNRARSAKLRVAERVEG